ncbi:MULTISPECIES: RNA-guided endonuclease InsQ/TnpB family protein [Calothrix]|uniref:IS200/IS605 family element transposase accessory protein TnpB n=2 Tax=Calothrix TaxID=1186 RepID=A0ABR8AHY5_9CYAN|nr:MULTISPECIES: RNA-guided endonuclease TnpB family protein [Calothrix]MBD2199359.1 IS200/IS605 family element transposase accessory protein TnpB [Calothrix parietina FACHB-288]MBD2229275.1 IS200/IS605 family element transposase accessory protein TnpB [Calothrix anomala FACHB-343]
MYAINRELKLNKKERSLMRGMAGFRRFVYNYALDLIMASWDFDGIKVGDSKRLDAIKKVFTQVTMNKPEYTWTKKYPSTVYQSAFQDLKNAFSRWRKALGEFPVKKSKKKGDSFTVYKTSGIYPEKGKPAIPFTNRVVINRGKNIALPGIKASTPLGFRLKERVNFICSSQTFTVSRTADRWFVSFVLDAEKVPPVIHPIEKIGVDLGVKTLATCSDGTTYAMPITTKIAKTKLQLLQWRNRNKVLGNKKLKIKASHNAHRFYTKVAKKHAHIANIRQDTTQKMTTDLSRKAYVIRIEDLNVQGMIANHKLADAVSNNCFYEIRRQLTYKQSFYGTKVELVDRWYPSSRQCCKCHHLQPMSLSDRIFNCQNCGHLQGRDENASINLENAPSDKVRLAQP